MSKAADARVCTMYERGCTLLWRMVCACGHCPDQNVPRLYARGAGGVDLGGLVPSHNTNSESPSLRSV